MSPCYSVCEEWRVLDLWVINGKVVENMAEFDGLHTQLIIIRLPL